VEVGGNGLTKINQAGIAIANGKVAENLVVGSIFFYQIKSPSFARSYANALTMTKLSKKK